MRMFWKIFSAFMALLLSIVLVVSLVALPVVSFLTENTDPSKLVKAVFESGILNDLGAPSAHRRPILLSNDAIIGTLPDGTNIEDLIEGGTLPPDFDIDSLPEGTTLPPNFDIDSLPEGTTLPPEVSDDLIENLPDMDLPEGVGMQELFGAVIELVEQGVIDVDKLVEELEIPDPSVIDQDKLVQELTQSSAVQQLASAYAEDIINAATGSGDAPKLNTENVVEMLSPHMEELVTIVEQNLPPEVVVNKDKLTQAVTNITNDALPNIVENLPPAKDVADNIVQSVTQSASPNSPAADPTMILNALKSLRNGTIRTIVIAVVAALLVLLFVFRLPSINGLRWMGVNGLISAVFVGILGYVLQAPFVLELLAELPSGVANLASGLLVSLASTFVTFAIIYGVAGLVLVIGNGVLNAVLAKKAPEMQAE